MIWLATLVLFVLACLAYVGMPLLRSNETWDTPDADTELDRLLAEKQRVLRVIKDVESEHLAGLMNQKDYDEAHAEYMEHAVDLNRSIASLTGVDPTRMKTEAAS